MGFTPRVWETTAVRDLRKTMGKSAVGERVSQHECGRPAVICKTMGKVPAALWLLRRRGCCPFYLVYIVPRKSISGLGV